MEEESLQERQSNELEVLKAIFTDQFVDCNENCSKWKPLNIILTVFPLREHSGPLEAHVQLDLHVIASEEYPNKVPIIMLEKSKGLSDKQLAEIQKNLEELASLKVGEVMIYELIQYVQSVLTESNKPGFQSFYEEMLSRQKEQKQKEVERLKSEENIKRQLIELEVKGIKKERQRKKKVNSKLSESTESNGSPTDHKCFLKRTKNTDTKTDVKYLIENAMFSLNSDARLVREFEILDFIGKGAYGDVLKVRNKLDDGLYAIKRIKLNQKNIHINKKIMREVKLLSRLNHENVVRYYYSWLEDLESPEYKNQEELKKEVEKYHDKSSLENLNLSFPCPDRNPSFSDEDYEDDDADDWIEFINNDESIVISTDTVDSAEIEIDEVSEYFHNQCMYIQMEYCEKSTLRNAIDDNLFKDENRVWRLLREVVEGLLYIHQQGIIHRDLKPMNIFIDSNDHVKIGDFGLATPNKPGIIKMETSVNQLSSENRNVEQQGTDASYTGQVGTALYVAPELNTRALNIHYNQKVDIYSLGIIFFEMCYRPFNTEMERYKVLTNLRLNSRNFPEDFYEPQLTRQIKLIRELLNHNPCERPTAFEILEKKDIPLAELESEKLNETIRHTLCNPQSKMYKHLIAECFSQKVSVAEDITFDEASSHVKIAWQHAFIEKMADNARKVFRLHGGIYFSTPFLSPLNGVGISDAGVVSLMTRSGSLINMPFDLRLAFARYLAQNPSVTHMKRYTVEKTFRERRMFGTHPRETFECTFDIVSPSSCNLTLEAEVLSIVCEFLNSFEENLQKNCIIRLNHISLVSAILFHHRIMAKKHIEVCNFLNKIKKSSKSLTKMDTSAEFLDFGLSETVVADLIQALNVEISPNKMMIHFSNLMKKSSASGSHSKLAIEQLEILVQYLAFLQIKSPIVIAPSVMSNFHYYSGIMFQVVWEQKGKNRHEKDIIAAGGRYDNLIAMYRNALNIQKETKQSAVGLTIFFDKLTNSLQTVCQFFSTVDVLVCSVGKTDMASEKLKIMKELWSAEIRGTILHVEQSLEETENYCEKMNIPHIVFIKESEPGLVRLRSWFKDRFHEKKLILAEIVPYLQRTIRHNSANSNIELAVHTVNQHHNRSESKSAQSSNFIENSSINFTFIFDEKLNSSNKRRYENQIFNSITNSLHNLSSKAKVEVIVLNVEFEIIKALVSSIDLNTKDNCCFHSLSKRFPKFKKCLNRIADFVEELQSYSATPVIIFFSLQDNNFKILL